MPPASRITDIHACPAHGPPPVASGSADVMIGYLPAARVADILSCVPPDVIVKGAPSVFINYRQAVRLGDPTAHGGKLAAGCPTVMIGSSGQGEALAGASASGKPFCEECEKAKKALEKQAKEQEAAAAPPGSATTAPPATTSPPETALKGVTQQDVALAKAPGTSPEQEAARQKVATSFYEQNGVRYDREGNASSLTPAQVRSHLKGIDLTQPVSFGPQPGLPVSLHQWQAVGRPQGQYYAPLGTAATALGIHTHATPPDGGPPVPKSVVPYDMHPHGSYLTSTAAPINDTWSVEGESHPCEGGGQQFYVPNRAHAKAGS